MAIQDKKIVLMDLEKQLGSLLTADQLTAAMEIVATELGSCELTYQADGAEDSGELLEAFIGAKRIEGRSEKTLQRYSYIIGKLTEACRVPLGRINVYHLRAYLAQEKGRGIADRTLEGYREIYSSFFGWLHKEGLLKANPCSNLSPIKIQKKVRLPYSDVDLEKIKEACTCDRDRALVYFLRATGCRISEVVGLNRTDVDLTRLECTVLGKGNKERTVYFDRVTAMMLQRYLEARTDFCEALFANHLHQRLQPDGARYILKQIEAHGSLENVHPHRFRRTLATSLINSGMAIQDVAAILGHEKLDTTMQYVYQSSDKVKQSYARYA